MQATYLALSVLFLMGQKLRGTVLSSQESEDIMPRYPLMFTPANAAWCLAHRLVPGGAARLQRLGRDAQKRQLKTLTA